MIIYGQITALFIGSNLHVVSAQGQERPVFFNPERFADPWFTPLVGDWVALGPGVRGQWHALGLLGKGTPIAEPPI